MIIFLSGSDTHRLHQRSTELINRYRAKYASGMNLVSVDLASEQGLTMLTDAVKNASFFDEVKLIIVRNAFTKATADASADLISSQDLLARKDTVLLVREDRSHAELKRAHKGLFALLAKGTTVESFDFLAGAALDRWITEEAARHVCTLAPGARAELINRVGTATWALAQEIQKLANYRESGGITQADVVLLVPSSPELNIFDLTDAFGSRNTAQAITLLYQQLQNGQDPYYLLTMLTYHVRNLLALKEGGPQVARVLGMHPFVARKAGQQAQRFEVPELRELFNRCVELEQATKQGTATLQDELYRIVLN